MTVAQGIVLMGAIGLIAMTGFVIGRLSVPSHEDAYLDGYRNGRERGAREAYASVEQRARESGP